MASEGLARALRQAGWMEVRRRGSHVVLRREGRPAPIVVPVHAATILKPKTLLSIIDGAAQGGIQSVIERHSASYVLLP